MRKTCWLAIIATTLAAASVADAVSCYIPMGEQLTGGFDHMQALMVVPQRFDVPTAASLFWAYQAPSNIDALAHEWHQDYNNGVFMDMDGPSIGDYALVWDWWAPATPPIGTTIHFQAYLGSTRKDSADLVLIGADPQDPANWSVSAGTWIVNKVLHAPQWIPGDADLDGDVDFHDYLLLQAGFGKGTTWYEGNFDGDNNVDFNDYLILQASFGDDFSNYQGVEPNSGGTGLAFTSGLPDLQPEYVPEPATLTLVLMAAGGALFVRRKR